MGWDVRDRNRRARRFGSALVAVLLGAAVLTGCLTTPGDLAGTVHDTAGTALAGIVVTLVEPDGTVVETTTTDAAGEYELVDVEPGFYKVWLRDDAGPYLDWWHAGSSGLADATAVAIGDGGTTVVDATMITAATGATIAGTVTDAVTAAPVAGVAVTLLGPSTTVVRSTTSGAAGTYQIDGLSPGSYVVRFGPTGPYAASYSGGGRSFGTATPIAATPGGSTVSNGTVLRSGAITGRVRTALTIGADFPVPAGLTVFAAVPGDLAHPVATTTTAADGAYSLSPLPPGPILVGFVDSEGLAGIRGFAPAFSNTPRNANPATATPITVTAGGRATAPTMQLTGADCDPARFPGSGAGSHFQEDLAGARLAGCSFGWGSSFGEADLSGADLTRVAGAQVSAGGASFAGARLTDSVFTGGGLSDTDFTGADLRRASLSSFISPFGTLPMDLSRADFTDADLTGARFDGATLTDAVWSNTSCPDGTNSDAAGGTCEGHLTP